MTTSFKPLLQSSQHIQSHDHRRRCHGERSPLYPWQYDGICFVRRGVQIQCRKATLDSNRTSCMFIFTCIISMSYFASSATRPRRRQDAGKYTNRSSTFIHSTKVKQKIETPRY